MSMPQVWHRPPFALTQEGQEQPHGTAAQHLGGHWGAPAGMGPPQGALGDKLKLPYYLWVSPHASPRGLCNSACLLGGPLLAASCPPWGQWVRHAEPCNIAWDAAERKP